MHPHTKRQIATPIPFDEAGRIEALRCTKLIGSEPDTNFDAIATKAAQLFECPAAVISLVDKNRQWFKSKIGLTVEEAPRNASICAYTILSPIDDVLIVLDTHLDERFATNPLVVGEPFTRFYAGAQVEAPGGHRIGALCILDRQPRSDFSKQQRKQLKALARQVSETIKKTVDTQNARRISSIDAKVGRKLKQARIRAQLSQLNLADHLGITVTDIESMEHGSLRIEASRLWKLSELLDVPLRYFFQDL